VSPLVSSRLRRYFRASLLLHSGPHRFQALPGPTSLPGSGPRTPARAVSHHAPLITRPFHTWRQSAGRAPRTKRGSAATARGPSFSGRRPLPWSSHSLSALGSVPVLPRKGLTESFPALEPLLEARGYWIPPRPSDAILGPRERLPRSGSNRFLGKCRVPLAWNSHPITCSMAAGYVVQCIPPIRCLAGDPEGL